MISHTLILVTPFMLRLLAFRHHRRSCLGPRAGLGYRQPIDLFVELQQSSYLRLLALGRLQGAQPLN